jgi:hypothetical protein
MKLRLLQNPRFRRFSGESIEKKGFFNALKLDALKCLKQVKYKKGKCLITVSGAHSGAGKTFVIEQLLKVLKGWSCIKVSVSQKGFCPKESACGICESLKGEYSLISDKKVIEEKGKDTHRFRMAGARKVLWLITKPGALRRGIKDALSRLRNPRGIIIEGTSVLKYVKPDVAIFVRKHNSELKESAREVLKKVDIILNV